MTAWSDFVKTYAKEHGISYKEAMKEAKESYAKKKYQDQRYAQQQYMNDLAEKNREIIRRETEKMEKEKREKEEEESYKLIKTNPSVKLFYDYYMLYYTVMQLKNHYHLKRTKAFDTKFEKFETALNNAKPKIPQALINKIDRVAKVADFFSQFSNTLEDKMGITQSKNIKEEYKWTPYGYSTSDKTIRWLQTAINKLENI